jgi:hypothetical protein
VIGGRVLDASMLVGFALVHPYPQALVWTAVEEGMVLAVPAAALAAAWARTPAEAHDALAVLLHLPNTVVEPLGATEAQEIGAVLARAGSDDDVRAGQVAACGIRRGWPVVTADARTLRLLNPQLDVDELP